VKDARAHHVRAYFAGTDIALENGQKWLVCGTLFHTVDGLEGHHGLTDCNQIAGWAWDSARPDTPIDVVVYDGDILLATVQANVFRPDLLAAGVGNGKHGFVYRTPSTLKDGKPHVLRVRIAGTGIDLRDTLQLLICTGTSQGPQRE
jgi:hypothetical protein